MLELSLLQTLLALVPLAIGAGLYARVLGKPGEIGLASARMLLQLVAVGYLLTFLFDYRMPLLGLAVLSFMLLAASYIAMRPLQQKSARRFWLVTSTLLLAGGFNLAWILLVVMRLDPWYQPSMVIPLAGMVFANGMNSLSVGAERLQSECDRQPLTPEAYCQAKQAAFNAALIPVVNSFFAVGLVSLPGMMTGQILSGVSPLVAVRYQIMVMSMIFSTGAMAMATYLWLHGRSRWRPTLSE